MKQLFVSLGLGYPIYFFNNILENDFLINYFNKLTSKLVIITDSNLKDHFAKKVQSYLKENNFDCKLIYFSAGDANKTREIKQSLEDQLLEYKFGRDTLIIAVGGGVVTDIAGFVASTYCRGIPVIYIPTTLLAMVDASIGGKTGVNTNYGKNMIGTFYQPQAVLIDFENLNSLSNREFNNGLVEVIKHSIIADYKLFTLLEKSPFEAIRDSNSLLEQIVFTSCCIKKNITEQDEKDNGIRQLLNFGHTIGHAIELAENYSISHGEAVAIGMIVESYIAQKMGMTRETNIIRLYNLLKSYQLPLKTNAFNDKTKFKELLLLDKKTISSLPKIVLLNDIGSPHHTSGIYSFTPPEEILDHVLNWANCEFH